MKDGFCSMGLLQVAKANPEHVSVLAGIIREQFPGRSVPPEVKITHEPSSDARVVAFFNDHPDTTFADVERVFEKAEVAWDERV